MRLQTLLVEPTESLSAIQRQGRNVPLQVVSGLPRIEQALGRYSSVLAQSSTKRSWFRLSTSHGKPALRFPAEESTLDPMAISEHGLAETRLTDSANRVSE